MEIKRSGKKLSLDYKKLDKFFEIVIETESKKYISKRMGMTYQTFFNYRNAGEKHTEQYREILEEAGFFDIDLSDYENDFNELLGLKEEEYMDRFKISSIYPKHSDKFFKYFEREKILFLEKAVYRQQRNILDKIEFDKKDIQKNEDIKVLLLFYHIYERADMANFNNYMSMFQEAAQDSKNIRFVENRLKKFDKEEFLEEIPERTENHNINFNLLDLCLQKEAIEKKQQFLITDNESIIDAEYESEEE